MPEFPKSEIQAARRNWANFASWVACSDSVASFNEVSNLKLLSYLPGIAGTCSQVLNKQYA